MVLFWRKNGADLSFADFNFFADERVLINLVLLIGLAQLLDI